jgi:hypothetical protein
MRGQEYKRSHGKVDYFKSSSGSLSSVSLSSSTDCLEEFQGDAPFAGMNDNHSFFYFNIINFH